MRTGAAYVRVSTDDQLEFSPDSQLHKIEEYARNNGILLSKEHIFMEDEGRSGRDAKKRPEFQRMIRLAKNRPKPFDVILVWKFSRFARNREDSIVYKSMLRKQCGIDVVSVSETVGDDKMSILIEAIIEAMDEWYSVNLAEEVVRGMAEKASRGGVVGSPAFGYLVRDGTFIPDPERAPVVRLIFEKYVLGGMSCFEIACMLNAMGIRTKKGGKMETRSVAYMLRNPVYIGKIRWHANGKASRDFSGSGMVLSDGQHQPIISGELFMQAQEKLDAAKARYPSHTRLESRAGFMLKGLVRCSECGSTLVRSRKAGLQCHSYARGECPVSHYISFHIINQRVIQLIEKSFQTKIFDFCRKPSLPAQNLSAVIEKQLAKEYQKLEKIQAAYEEGIDTLHEYQENKSRIMQAIKTLEKQKKTSEPISLARQGDMANRADLVSLLKNPDIPEGIKNKILKAFLNGIIFDRKNNQIKLFFCV